MYCQSMQCPSLLAGSQKQSCLTNIINSPFYCAVEQCKRTAQPGESVPCSRSGPWSGKFLPCALQQIKRHCWDTICSNNADKTMLELTHVLFWDLTNVHREIILSALKQQARTMILKSSSPVMHRFVIGEVLTNLCFRNKGVFYSLL